MAGELFNRIVNSSEDQERLARGPLFAAFREVATNGQTLADLKSQFNLSVAESADLDTLVLQYVGLPNAAAKAEYLRIFQDVMQLAEYQIPNWYNTQAKAYQRLLDYANSF